MQPQRVAQQLGDVAKLRQLLPGLVGEWADHLFTWCSIRSVINTVLAFSSAAITACVCRAISRPSRLASIMVTIVAR
jgi:hypothetical protein